MQLVPRVSVKNGDPGTYATPRRAAGATSSRVSMPSGAVSQTKKPPFGVVQLTPSGMFASSALTIVAEREAVFLQIGDGAIVLSAGEGWKHVFWPQHGEFANTTNFVTSEDALEVMEFHKTTEPVAELALFTDGLENLVLHKANRTVHAPFFDSMFPSVRGSRATGEDAELSRALAQYLSTPKINDRTNDDKTLILATRR